MRSRRWKDVDAARAMVMIAGIIIVRPVDVVVVLDPSFSRGRWGTTYRPYRHSHPCTTTTNDRWERPTRKRLMTGMTTTSTKISPMA
jgi:hypothetical protein